MFDSMRAADGHIQRHGHGVRVQEKNADLTPKFHYAKRRFSITSKYRHIYGVLNIDEIKN
jgi:hypothetical protein